MGGLELQEEILRAGIQLPVIIVTGHADVPLAVRAMKAGAIDFLEKPFDGETLLHSVEKALKVGQQLRDRAEEAKAAQRILASLTARERDVLDHLVKGQPNKVVAYELGISPRTVEIHRARIMSKMRARSLSDLVRVSLAAASDAAVIAHIPPAVLGGLSASA
jgi:two-component system response regulator FixJ